MSMTTTNVITILAKPNSNSRDILKAKISYKEINFKKICIEFNNLIFIWKISKIIIINVTI